MLCWAQTIVQWNWSLGKSSVIFLIQTVLFVSKPVLEEYINFSGGLFLLSSSWYNLVWNYHLEAQ